MITGGSILNVSRDPQLTNRRVPAGRIRADVRFLRVSSAIFARVSHRPRRRDRAIPYSDSKSDTASNVSRPWFSLIVLARNFKMFRQRGARLWYCARGCISSQLFASGSSRQRRTTSRIDLVKGKTWQSTLTIVRILRLQICNLEARPLP